MNYPRPLFAWRHLWKTPNSDYAYPEFQDQAHQRRTFPMVWRDQPRQLEFANRFGLLLLLLLPLLRPRLHHSPEKRIEHFKFIWLLVERILMPPFLTMLLWEKAILEHCLNLTNLYEMPQSRYFLYPVTFLGLCQLQVFSPEIKRIPKPLLAGPCLSLLLQCSLGKLLSTP